MFSKLYRGAFRKFFRCSNENTNSVGPIPSNSLNIPLNSINTASVTHAPTSHVETSNVETGHNNTSNTRGNNT